MAEFSETLLGCFGNSSLTCLGCYAPLFVFGKNAEKMGENPILWMAGVSMLPCIVGAYMRGMIRRKQVSEISFCSISEAWQKGKLNSIS